MSSEEAKERHYFWALVSASEAKPFYRECFAGHGQYGHTAMRANVRITFQKSGLVFKLPWVLGGGLMLSIWNYKVRS